MQIKLCTEQEIRKSYRIFMKSLLNQYPHATIKEKISIMRNEKFYKAFVSGVRWREQFELRRSEIIVLNGRN